MKPGSVRPESVWWLCSLPCPGLQLPVHPIPRVWPHHQVQNDDIHVSDGKIEEGWRKGPVLAVS